MIRKDLASLQGGAAAVTFGLTVFGTLSVLAGLGIVITSVALWKLAKWLVRQLWSLFHQVRHKDEDDRANVVDEAQRIQRRLVQRHRRAKKAFASASRIVSDIQERQQRGVRVEGVLRRLKRLVIMTVRIGIGAAVAQAMSKQGHPLQRYTGF